MLPNGSGATLLGFLPEGGPMKPPGCPQGYPGKVEILSGSLPEAGPIEAEPPLGIAAARPRAFRVLPEGPP